MVVGYDFGYGHLHSCGFSVVGSEWAVTAGHCGVRPSSSFTIGIHAQDEVTDDDKRFVIQVHTSSKLILKKTSLDDFTSPSLISVSCFYRPQGKVMFSHAFVILSTIGLMDIWSLLILVGFLATPSYNAVSTHPIGILSYCFFLFFVLEKWPKFLPFSYCGARVLYNRALLMAVILALTGLMHINERSVNMTPQHRSNSP